MADEKTFTQADIDAAVEAAKSPLDAKNRELLRELKDARKSATITPEQLAAVEDARDKALSDLAEAGKQIKTLTGERDKAVKALEAESGFTHKLLVENGLREALAANGVTNAIHQKAAMAMLASGVQVAADGDARVAKVGDKALADFVKEWAAGDEGKHFVAAPANGGGGAPGGGANGGTDKVLPRSQFDTMDPAGKMDFIKQGGKVVDQAA